jgi:hypothetical protein
LMKSGVGERPHAFGACRACASPHETIHQAPKPIEARQERACPAPAHRICTA